MQRQINTFFTDHDYEQIVLLAKTLRIRRTEMVRRMCRAYLDKSKPETRDQQQRQDRQ